MHESAIRGRYHGSTVDPSTHRDLSHRLSETSILYSATHVNDRRGSGAIIYLPRVWVWSEVYFIELQKDIIKDVPRLVIKDRLPRHAGDIKI